jgi:hypothetical protein
MKCLNFICLDENQFIRSIEDIDQPLLVVLDEDDDGDDENIYLTSPRTNSHNTLSNSEEQKPILVDGRIEYASQNVNLLEEQKFEVKNLIESVSTKKSKVIPGSKKKLSSKQQTSKKIVRTVVIDTNFVNKPPSKPRSRSASRRKNPPSSNSVDHMANKNIPMDDNFLDSILSNVSFENISNILTVSRMGSIYYCVEDLYLKVFSTICTLDEFTNFLEKSEVIILKQVTLSEKICIEQQIPILKKFNPLRYRLLSINSSDYLIKLKQLLRNKKNQRIDQIIDQMRQYKQTSTSAPSKDKGKQNKHFIAVYCPS